jgi:hypothetical protein
MSGHYANRVITNMIIIDKNGGDSRELNPAQEGTMPPEISPPERQTGNAPQTPTEPSQNDQEGQQGGRDSEEDGKWDGKTR